MITLARIQKAINKAGIPLELVRGEGYQYFVFDNGKHYDTVSVYVCYLKHYTVEQWVEEAQSAYEVVQAELRYQLSIAA